LRGEFAGQMRGKASEAQKRLKLRLKEASSDLEEYHRLFEQRLEGCQEGLDKLQELSTRLWKEIARSRRIPIGRLFGVLQKTVKELALEQGLEVQLVTAGGDIQVEKKLFETLFDPLLQLIRNALSHGIEPPEQRLKLGKNPLGTIRLMIEGQEDDLMITVEDDGRGLAGKTILQRAKLLFGPHAVNDGIDELIFLSGLTTKKDISEVAGRGIGMDVVATGINKLNGIIQVESEPGKFTRFHLRLPANRFYASVYIVRSMGHLFAIPTALVNADDRQNRFFHRSRYPIISLTSVLGGRGINRPSLLVGAVEKRFYLEVDEIIGVQSVVFTKLGRFFKNLPLVWGATLIRDGEMAFVLNLRYLFDAASKGVRAGRKFRERQHLIQRQTHEAATILVVDDSISVREFVSSILTTNGFRSHVAKDGQEALQLLQQRSYRLLITDLEMPRLDGHQLIDKLNAHHYESNVRRPEVLVITSRSEREERKRLLAKGVSELLSKPFNEKELLGAVNRLLSNANDRSNEFSGEMIYDTQSPFTFSCISSAIFWKSSGSFSIIFTNISIWASGTPFNRSIFLSKKFLNMVYRI
jgi:CheY-like chemotaxis protein/two-component sensor histidine kinase